MATTLSISLRDLAISSCVSSKQPGLDRLPAEVRLLIYEFTLIEPPRWDKKHRLKCKYKPGSTHLFEPPPFLQSQVTVDQNPWTIKTETPCSCAKRKGLSLLRVCKSIYKICSPIFWSRNKFCFLDAVEFLAAVGHCLRPELRNQIQDISIMNPDFNGDTSHIRTKRARYRYRKPFWETLLKCKGLEKLEIPAAYLERSSELNVSEYLNLLGEELPRLSSLHLGFLLPHSPYRYSNGYPPPWTETINPQVIYSKFSGQIHLSQKEYGPWVPEGVDELLRELQYNFRVHVDTTLKLKFFGSTMETLSEYESHFKLAVGLNENNDTRRVSLPSGQVATVKFYGLPCSAKTCRASFRYKLRQKQKQLEEEQKASLKDGKKHLQKASRSCREVEMNEERRKYQETHLDRMTRRISLGTEQKRSLKKASMKERQKIHRAVKTAGEIRAWERKRVPNASSGY